MKKSKSAKVAEYFLANPTAVPKAVGAKFKVAMPSVYGIRKRVLSGSMLDKTEAPIIERGYTHPREEFKPSQRAKDMQFGGDHYKNMGVEPWDVVDTWSREQRIGYYRGGALKYIMRMGAKDESPMEVAKGKHYMEKLLEVLNDAD
jgi:hypothetical protein